MKPVSQNHHSLLFPLRTRNECTRTEASPAIDNARIIKSAWLQAEKDIEEDPYFRLHLLTHDLDEGESARLGG